MRTKTKLILQFTLLFAALLSLVMIIIYWIVAKEIERNFYKRLEDRTLTVGHVYLARDNFSKQEYEEVLRKFPRTLSAEQIRIYDMNYKSMFIKEDGVVWDRATIDKVIKNKLVFFKRGDFPAVGIFYRDNSGDFVIMASAQDIHGQQSLRELAYAMLLSFIFAIVATVVLGNVFAQWILAPIKSIIKHMLHIEANKLNQKLSLNEIKNDEIETLKETINLVFERLHSSFETQQSFVSNASHELKTPIAVMMGNAEIALRKERTPTEYKETLHDVVKDCQRLDEIIHSLLALAQIDRQMQKSERFLFENFFWSVTDELMKNHPDITIAINLDAPEGLGEAHIKGNQSLLKIALSNIFQNAAKFSSYQEIEASIVVNAEQVEMAITDSGIGIPAAELSKIFTPFYRSKNALRFNGAGLGLTMAEKIVTLHQGKLSIVSLVGKGTTVKVSLPCI